MDAPLPEEMSAKLSPSQRYDRPDCTGVFQGDNHARDFFSKPAHLHAATGSQLEISAAPR
jgi:hypothetical protein